MWWIFSNFWRHLGRSVRTEEGNIVDIVGIPLCHRHNVGCKEHLWDEFCDFQKTYRKTLIELGLKLFDIWLLATRMNVKLTQKRINESLKRTSSQCNCIRNETFLFMFQVQKNPHFFVVTVTSTKEDCKRCNGIFTVWVWSWLFQT